MNSSTVPHCIRNLARAARDASANTIRMGTDVRLVREDHNAPVLRALLAQYTVRPARGTDILAWIRWYGRWDVWAFLPCEGTVWSADCLADVARWLAELAPTHGELADG